MGQDDLGEVGLAQGPRKTPLRLAFWNPSVRKTDSSCFPLPQAGESRWEPLLLVPPPSVKALGFCSPTWSWGWGCFSLQAP